MDRLEEQAIGERMGNSRKCYDYSHFCPAIHFPAAAALVWPLGRLIYRNSWSSCLLMA